MKIVAMRGRNGVQQLEISAGDYTNTLTSVQKDNLLITNDNGNMGNTIREGLYTNNEGGGGMDSMTKKHCWNIISATKQAVIQVNPSKESNGQQPYQQNRIYSDEGILQALNSQLSTGSNYVQLGGGESQKDRVFFEHSTMCTLQANRTDAKTTFLTKDKSIRRLMEKECERLQGLPDDHTKYGNYDGVTKEISATQRYRLCGNGVSVPIIKMLAEKLFDLNYRE